VSYIHRIETAYPLIELVFRNKLFSIPTDMPAFSVESEHNPHGRHPPFSVLRCAGAKAVEGSRAEATYPANTKDASQVSFFTPSATKTIAAECPMPFVGIVSRTPRKQVAVKDAA
jgi:hypothetical protein